MKYLHGWLANNDRQQKVGRNKENICLFCGEADNNFHMFYCQDPNLKYKLKGLSEGVIKKLERYLSRAATEALKIGRTQEQLGQGIQISSCFVIDPQVNRVYKHQFHLRWRQIYLGRFHRDWNTLTNTDANSQITPSMKNVIKVMWSYGLQLWQQCNLLLHGPVGDTSIHINNRMKRLVKELATTLSQTVEYDRRLIVNQRLILTDSVDN